jgi:hypothetical protein
MAYTLPWISVPVQFSVAPTVGEALVLYYNCTVFTSGMMEVPISWHTTRALQRLTHQQAREVDELADGLHVVEHVSYARILAPPSYLK